ncbi:hypothetical protein K2173_014592 [Erythroxylum novogranatense]|uniref:Uncharacterized protein n=1 Tax=Erythroxylum novogranatense TaxID=1862640 RepID=A0AAV8TGR7_9ROSI|nr:hypothetical protein K2173_014592 [Erythroxylum novogranatense]
MGTSILRSQDCLAGGGRLRNETLTLTKMPIHHNPNFSAASRRRKRTVAAKNLNRTKACQSMVSKAPAKNLVMGQVKILKRGESLGSFEDRAVADKRRPRYPDLVLGSTDRLGPDPEIVQKQIRAREINRFIDGVYAGSTVVSSPPPSSLPVPGFLVKIQRGKVE